MKEYRQHRFELPAGATDILLVRHGESRPATPDDPFPLVDGHGDPELAPQGREQAAAVGERLKDLPISAVYYPIEILPVWLQPVANLVPAAHVFEGMRGVLVEGVVLWEHFFAALALDLVYLALGSVTFYYAFKSARDEGKLLQMGE